MCINTSNISTINVHLYFYSDNFKPDDFKFYRNKMSFNQKKFIFKRKKFVFKGDIFCIYSHETILRLNEIISGSSQVSLSSIKTADLRESSIYRLIYCILKA